MKWTLGIGCSSKTAHMVFWYIAQMKLINTHIQAVFSVWYKMVLFSVGSDFFFLSTANVLKLRIHFPMHNPLIFVCPRANALVSSKLDYAILFLLSSITGKDLRRIQLIQNTSCRVVCQFPWRSHVSQLMKSLRWLPQVQNWIKNGSQSLRLGSLTIQIILMNTWRSNPDNKIVD